jgi:hypothetical protein
MPVINIMPEIDFSAGNTADIAIRIGIAEPDKFTENPV